MIEINISESLLTIFEGNIIFRGSQGSNEIQFEPKI